MYKWIDHVVVRVSSLDKAIATYRDKLGMKLERRGELRSQGIKNAVFPLGRSGRFLELVEPLGPETPVGRALARSGEGVHLVALAVENLGQAAQDLKAQGVELLDQTADGQRFVFIHPRATHGVLIQLVERK
ncbi:MAG: VOC family protein [Chloroflexi bacterium]|nr:VOC family protein [Chloroflexota bacterium]